MLIALWQKHVTYALKSSFGAGKERGKCAQVSSWPIISPQKSTPNWVNSSTSPRETKCFSKGENKTIAHSGAEHERHELNQGEHLKKMSFSCWGQLEKNFGYNSCVPCPKKPFWFPAILLPASQLRKKAHHSPVQTGMWALVFVLLCYFWGGGVYGAFLYCCVCVCLFLHQNMSFHHNMWLLWQKSNISLCMLGGWYEEQCVWKGVYYLGGHNFITQSIWVIA